MNNTDTETAFSLPGWVTIILAVGGIATIAFLLPVFEMLEQFFFVVAVPLMILGLTGVISKETYNYISNFAPNVVEDLKTRVAEDGKEHDVLQACA